MSFFDLHWANPWCFLFSLIIPLGWWFRHWLERQRPTMAFPTVFVHNRMHARYLVSMIWLPLGLRLLALLTLVFVMMRPQISQPGPAQEVTALNIILAVDVSPSMQAEDFKPNRLKAAQAVLDEFVKSRGQDRIGLVVFSGIALTLAPLTFDHAVVRELLQSMNVHMVREEGTAMGDALLAAAARMQDVQLMAKPAHPGIIILATDGVNNCGIQPRLAARVLAAKGIRLYTIGVGEQKPVLRYSRDWDGNRIVLKDVYGQPQYFEKADETLLREMAAATQGCYFQAGNREAFAQTLTAIDRLEKNRLQSIPPIRYADVYSWFLAVGILCLLLEYGLRCTRFKTLLEG